jgi:hypothetical protein
LVDGTGESPDGDAFPDWPGDDVTPAGGFESVDVDACDPTLPTAPAGEAVIGVAKGFAAWGDTAGPAACADAAATIAKPSASKTTTKLAKTSEDSRADPAVLRSGARDGTCMESSP